MPMSQAVMYSSFCKVEIL